MYTRWPSYPKTQRQDIRITLPVLALAAELPTWLAQIILWDPSLGVPLS